MAFINENEYSFISFSDDEFTYCLKNYTVLSHYKINDVYLITILIDYKTKKKITPLFNNRNVSYSSAIASKARIKLYKGFQSVIKNGGRPLYCDTDSIFAAYNKNNTSPNVDNIT
jgi:hypothetical protein